MLESLFELTPEIYNRADEMEMFPVLQREGVKCIIYGAGNGGRFLLDWMRKVYDILPDFIVDSQPPAKSLGEVPVISADEFRKMNLDRFFIVISVVAYHNNKEVREEINRIIEEAGKDTEYLRKDGFDILAPIDLGWY